MGPTQACEHEHISRARVARNGGTSIIITGSPKFDALVEAGKTFDRERTRKRVGVAHEAAMVVVASRFTAIGPVFTDLVRASQAIEGLWLLVKPHQAERADDTRRRSAPAPDHARMTRSHTPDRPAQRWPGGRSNRLQCT